MKFRGWEEVRSQQSRDNRQTSTQQHGLLSKEPTVPGLGSSLGYDGPFVQSLVSSDFMQTSLELSHSPTVLGLETRTFVHTTIGFFEAGNPRPGALLDFLCLYKTCQAGLATFLSRPPLKCQDIRTQRDKVSHHNPKGQTHRPQVLLKACRSSLKWWGVFLKTVKKELWKVRSKSNALCFYHYCWPLSKGSKMHPSKLAVGPVVASIIIFACTQNAPSSP